MAVAKVADGDEDEEELKSPVDPKSGSITDDELVAVELKQLPAESFAAEDEDVGIDEIDEPL